MKVGNPKMRYDRLHLGCGLIAPHNWLNVDGSFQATLTRYPHLRRFMGRVGLVSQTQIDIPWPKNVFRLNVRKRLPLMENSFIAVYSSHLLEHLHRSEALRLFQECKRILKPGGICRAVVPDLEYLVHQYIKSKQSQSNTSADPARDFLRVLQLRPEASPSGPWPYRLYQKLTDFHSHKWMYDKESLLVMFIEAGFHHVAAMGFRESRIPGIEEVEEESRIKNGAGVCVEGVKP